MNGRLSRAQAAARSWVRRRDRATPLALKLFVPPIVFIVLVASVYSVLASAFVSDQLDAAYRNGAHSLAFTLQAEYAHEDGRAEALGSFVRELVAADPSVVRVRFYRYVDGRPVVWASSNPGDVGSYRPDDHDIRPIETGTPEQSEEEVDGRTVLETISPVVVAGRVEASVGIYTSLRARDAAIAEALRLVALTATGGTILLCGALVAVAQVAVLRRIRRLQRAAQAVASGDLSVRLPEGHEPPARDEIVTVSREFDHMVRAVAGHQAEIERLAVTDGLTGLSNRRAFDERLAHEIGRAKRLGYALALSLVDLDGFKALNDSAGHLAGDDALRQVARALERAVRQTDVVARYGGDEFAVIHPGCDLAAAAIVGARARAAVEALGIRSRDRAGRERLLSASVGTTQYRPPLSGEDLLAAADTALYRAKVKGGGVEVGVSPATEDRPQSA